MDNPGFGVMRRSGAQKIEFSTDSSASGVRIYTWNYSKNSFRKGLPAWREFVVSRTSVMPEGEEKSDENHSVYN
jgi:hypothetical protein